MRALLCSCLLLVACADYGPAWDPCETHEALCLSLTAPGVDLRPVVDMNLSGADLLGWCAPTGWACASDSDCCPTENADRAWPSVCQDGVCKVGECGRCTASAQCGRGPGCEGLESGQMSCLRKIDESRGFEYVCMDICRTTVNDAGTIGGNLRFCP